ncbi:Polyprenol reductase [Tritrichomonas foetus]|uniref:Polyprenol reductase n=1 Tax=Tritrichomonas foetus TaxID=1144522 RepID=A0A1J4KK91_9EUKA|nr:Polyprenol reductase [Tritrichomonas foetus]|eukprot:OHT11713.1 Polyprenol reductase [Tritrichomonas foetus]
MLPEIIEFGISLLPYILPLLWICAIIVYSAKFFSSSWDQFTRFGKLENTNAWFNMPTISNKIGWIIFYSFSCFMFLITFLIRFPPSFSNILLCIHSFRRLNESLFITKFSNRKMHLINFLAGLLFYAMAPITLAYCSNSDNDYYILLIFLAFVLNIFQFLSHQKLSALKKYSIPNGWLFTKLTSPHYFLEIVLYFVYFLLSPHVLTFLMFTFVFINLSHQSIMTYQWYIDKFGIEFTSLHRYIIIPFIY